MIYHYNRNNQIFVTEDFKSWLPSSMERPVFPFDGDSTSYLLEQEYIGRIDYYLETRPEPGTAHTNHPDVFFITDGEIRELGGGIGEVSRTYGTLPGFGNNSKPRLEMESYVWTKPGITTDDWTSITYYPVTSQNVVGGNLRLYASITDPSAFTNATTGFAKYKAAGVYYKVTDPISGAEQDRVCVKPLITVHSDGVTIENISDIGSIEVKNFSQPFMKRDPIQLVVPSYLYFDYSMSNLNIDSPEDIDILQPWKVLDAAGNETQYLSETTHPPLFSTATEKGFNEMVEDKDKIVVECSIRRWRGDIWERAVRYIRLE